MKRFSLALIPLLIFCSELNAQQAVVPTEPISLLDESSFAFFLNPEHSLTDKHAEAWSFSDNQLHVTGKGWGALVTHKSYHDYHLVLDYKWGEHSYGERADRARSSGLLIHGQAQEANINENNLNGIQILLTEGASGYFGKNDKPAGWKDERGFRKTNDVENPVGEWNRLEVICQGENIRTLLNGKTVQQLSNSGKRDGTISLQSRGAEIRVRRFELWPLGGFTEPWIPEVSSTNTGMADVGEGPLPRRFPWSPEESLAAWQIDGDYDIELVAAEPVVRDPVDVVWDEHGRMFVAEMGDYPLPTEPGPLLSRIRLLSDQDGDGRMDLATTWADNLDHVQGMLPMNGGLLITTRTAILFLKDTDGDGTADEQRPVFISNEPRHSQLQVSTPRWGVDNTIYLNNGLDGMEIYPSDSPQQTVPFRGWDLRYDPRTETITKSTGKGQYGGSIDNWGHRIFCSNRNPIMFAVMPAEAVERNPFAAITQGHEDIQAPGAPVWPLLISHTTASTHLGTHTAACGLAVYRGDQMPELLGNIFVCEPTGQLVTRNRLVPQGASFTAERIGDRREFLSSTDEWCRPVQIRNGPDGALYICDMYRRFIDHARFFPEAFSETNYMRAGLDQGRIWRLKPKGAALRKIQPLPKSNDRLVKLLESENAWQRIHAQRLLVERQATEVIPAIEKCFLKSPSATGRLHAMWTLHGLGALTHILIEKALADREPGVVENAISLADPDIHTRALLRLAVSGNSRMSFLAALALGSSSHTNHAAVTAAYLALLRQGGFSDPWFRQAVLSAKVPPTAELLAGVLGALEREGVGREKTSEDLADFLREFTAETAARGDMRGLRQIVSRVTVDHPRATDAPIVEGLSTGLKRSSLPVKTIDKLISSPLVPLTQKDLKGIQSTLDSAAKVALDRNRSSAERLASLPLVREQGKDEVFAVARQLIHQSESPEIQAAACQILSRVDRAKVAEFYFEEWENLGPTPRKEALEFLCASDQTAIQLMRHMQSGNINASLMPAFQRWRLARRDNEEIQVLFQELYGSLSSDRASVIEAYSNALRELSGDPIRGKQVFEKAACITCHRLGGLGVDVGPGLADVRFKLPDALLSDILDPNRAVEERWSVYTLETHDGRSLSGLIASETASALEIRFPGGSSETVSRNHIAKLETTGASLMPVGLEGIVSTTDMADLIAFLTKP
jgi:putative membrane-bound dehydrogenase-like protein